MAQRPDGEQPELTGWVLVRMVVREFVRDVRHPTPLTVRYLRCDGCGQVTAHSTDRRLYTIDMARRDITAPPPEAVCDACGHAQPRTVGDEVPVDVTVTCAGTRYRRFGSRRSRRPCGHQFAVPAAAPAVLCPWCATDQPNPARRQPQR
ncbi:hypothetical protein [Dactylosporangium sp. CA-092794]|uniref:hypothetical protein n=1 Tax=Dactylosporangium sp. CA-092794 TaxID=3239929 RepID=UPI003D8DE6BB